MSQWAEIRHLISWRMCRRVEMATEKGLPTIWQGPRCRSERAYLAHGQPRPSTRRLVQ